MCFCATYVLGNVWYAHGSGAKMMPFQPSLFPADPKRPILDVLFNPRRTMSRGRKSLQTRSDVSACNR